MTEPEEFDREEYDDEPPRSILAALWFRALLVVLVLGVIAVLAAPSLLDVVVPRGGKRVASAPAPAVTPSPGVQADASQTAPTAVAQAPAVAAPVMAVTPPATESTATSATPGPSRESAAAPGAKPAETSVAPKSTPSAAAPAKAPRATAPAAPAPASPHATSETRVAARTPEATRGEASASGEYWVQVAAFKDRDSAHRLVTRLRERNYRVEESVRGPVAGTSAPAAPAPPASSDRYEVFVAGVAPEEIAGKLAGKGVTAEAVAGGVLMRPPLPLADALALSKDLAGDGRRVQVRRTGAAERERIAAAPAPGETFYRVRIGGFADRTAAQAVARELEAKGYRPFIARGDQ